MRNLSIFFTFLVLIIASHSCKTDPPAIDYNKSKYPKEIANIMLTKCAVSGCHNDISKDAAAGLSLSTWDNMMQGSRNSAVVIPYAHKYSTLFLFTNTFDDLGVKVTPTMPVGKEALTKEEVIVLRDWIESGARDNSGFSMFSDNSLRKKIYITNQGCDIVSVIDAESSLLMRYVNVGHKAQIESPHMIKVSPDGKYWYVVFTAGDVIQKYRTSDDSFVGEVNIGSGNWNTLSISSDSKKAFAVDWNSNGTIAYVDLVNMTMPAKYQGSGLFTYPHGIAISPDNNVIYVTAQTGNFIYKIDVSNPLFPEDEKIVLEPGQAASTLSSFDPHEIAVSPDGSKYFVTCQKTNEVRIFDIENDSLIAVVSTGKYPQEMSFSETYNYLFVTCTEDDVTNPGKRGSVSIINLSDNSHIKTIYTGHQPHGIAVIEENMEVYVAHRNIESSGPAPHHTTDCGGRNGYITVIDLNTLELKLGRKTELVADPYSVAYRH